MTTTHSLRPFAGDEAGFRALADGIAAQLGTGWSVTSVQPDYDRGLATLTGPDSADLNLRPDSPDSSRLAVSGVYPRTEYRPDRFSISVRADRGPAVIAREIARRLLPGYLAELAKVRAYNDTEARNTTARQAVMTQVAAMFGMDTTAVRDDGHYSSQVSLYHLSGHAYGTVRASADASTLTLDLRCIPRDAALAILAELAKITKEENPS